MQKDNTKATRGVIERRGFAAATIGGIVAAVTGTMMTSSSALAQDSNSTISFPQTLVEARLFTGPAFSIDLAAGAFEQVVNVFEIGAGRTEILQAFRQVLEMLSNPTTAAGVEQAVLGVNTAISRASLSPLVSAILFGTARAIICGLLGCPSRPVRASQAFEYELTDWDGSIGFGGVTIVCHYKCFPIIA
jgi:hypothetical protein